MPPHKSSQVSIYNRAIPKELAYSTTDAGTYTELQ